MSVEINGEIKLVGEEGGQKIQLIIPENDREKFKEYKNIDQNGKVIEGHYASFCLELEDDKEVTCVATSGKDGKFFID
ncbi:hypothetical protein [Wolbachia endosymbiont (group A) of Lypha dubia]